MAVAIGTSRVGSCVVRAGAARRARVGPLHLDRSKNRRVDSTIVLQAELIQNHELA